MFNWKKDLKEQNETILIVGAGITGATMARLLADKGYKVIVSEKENHVGGACYDSFKVDTKLYKQHFGSHIFHTSNEKVWKFINRFTEFLPYQHKVEALINGVLVPLPFNFNSLERLFPERLTKDFFDQLIKVFGYNSEVTLKELLECSEESIQDLGKFIQENVFEGYSMKQWGKMPKPEVLNRLKAIRVNKNDCYFTDKYQGIPVKGFTHMIKTMLNHENIQVKMEDYSFRYPDYKQVFYSGSIDELLGYKYGALPYRTCHFIFDKLSTSKYQNTAVVNYPNNYQFTRQHDFGHYIPSTMGTIICQEYSRQWDKKSDLPRLYPINSESSDKLHRKYLNLLLESFEGKVLPIGRLGMYKYYDMDDAIETALELANAYVKQDNQIKLKDCLNGKKNEIQE